MRVERAEQIGPALDAMLADDGPFLIDLVLNNDVSHDVAQAKHASRPVVSASAISRRGVVIGYP